MIQMNDFQPHRIVPSYKVAVVQWVESDELARALYQELAALGHDPQYFWCEDPLPPGVDVVFTFAPYGHFLRIASQLEQYKPERRPVLVHWNTEGMPDLRLPWWSVRTLGRMRSWAERLFDQPSSPVRKLLGSRITAWQSSRMLRFRYIGDYHYAYARGWLQVFADSSAVYAQIHSRHGLPTHYFPWGAVPEWSADLGLERDIDVLWMGKRGTKRRGELLDRITGELRRQGKTVYIADNEEQPYIFGAERTHYLNRAKIVLNITRTWYDDNFSRFAMAAPNRALIVSEPMLPHCPEYEAGVHYVSAPPAQLADAILYYLEHEAKRARIVENAWRLLATDLTMRRSVQRVMDEVASLLCRANATSHHQVEP